MVRNFCVLGGAVRERVHRAVCDEDDLALMQLALFAVDRERRDAGEAVVGLFESVVAVRGGHRGVGGDVALERRRAAVGGIGVEHESDAEGSDADGVRESRGHGRRQLPVRVKVFYDCSRAAITVVKSLYSWTPEADTDRR